MKESTFYLNMLLTSKQHILGILGKDYSSLFDLLQTMWPWNVSGIHSQVVTLVRVHG